MKFSKAEQKIIKVIVECENQCENLAAALNYSRLLEERGIGIVGVDNANLVFLRKDLYPNFFPFNDNVPYISVLVNLIEKLIKNGDIICGESSWSQPLVIGAIHSEWIRPGVIAVNGNETIIIEGPYKGWYGADRQEKYFWWDKWNSQLSKVDHYLYSGYCVSEELKDFVKNKFRSEEEIRFAKQQRVTWISIAVAIILGVVSILFNLWLSGKYIDWGI